MNAPRFTPYNLRHGPAPEPIPEHTATFTLDRQIARARREMGEARWAELNADWERG